MRRSTLAICALLTAATFGCDQVNAAKDKLKVAWDKIRGRPTATHTPPAPIRPAPDTAAARQAAEQQQRQVAHHPRPPSAPEGTVVNRDVPYISDDTGTIAPGMSEREIYGVWGAPAATRRAGEYTYLFFRNGCEYTCGTEDIVTLQNGHVVDAVLRWPGHGYSGQSSSPSGTMPHPNPGGDTLTVRPPGTP